MNQPLALCTFVIIGVTVLVSWRGFRSAYGFEEKYIFNPEAILAGKEYYRLLTAGFLHADWHHLILNMLTLLLFGPADEAYLGRGNFLLVYLGAIIGGNLLSLYVHRNHEYRAYGASGGVCGILFAYILLFKGAAIFTYYFPIPVPGWAYAIGYLLFSFYGMKEHNRGNIGHDAHLGGAIIGLVIAAGLEPKAVRHNSSIFVIVLAAAVLLLVYLWFNPLFLPAHAFAGRGSFGKRRDLPNQGRENLQVDRVLERIAREGLDSVTADERKLLEEVSHKFQRRAQSEKPKSGLTI